MHGVALAQNILKHILAEAETQHALRVKRIEVKVGPHLASEADSVKFCLEMAAIGTSAAGAEVIINERQIYVRCPECHAEFLSRDGIAVCPQCGLAGSHDDHDGLLEVSFDLE